MIEDAEQGKMLQKLKSDRSIRSFASGRNSVDVVLKKDLPNQKEATLKEEIRKKRGQMKIQEKEAKYVESKGEEMRNSSNKSCLRPQK